MAKFPVEVFTRNNALLGYDDRYKSSLLNQKFAGFPKGAYIGFAPSVSPPSPILTLAVSPSEGYSLLKVPSGNDPGGLDIVVDTALTLDFTGQPSGDFPIHVLARASYTDDPSTPTTAELFTRSAGAVAYNEVLLCVVDGTPTTLTVAFDPSIGERDAPLAYAGVEFGFMPAGSVEDLAAATDVALEVTAARLGLDTVTYDSLSDRLAADQSASGMASRLGHYVAVLRSNDYLAEAGELSVNVSGSFSEINRDHEPKITLGGQGSETEIGAIASPNDEIRNVAIIQETATGYRLLDDTTNRRIIFGRVVGPMETSITGVFSFQNAQKGVSVVGGAISDEAEVGDLLQGADGKFYEIATIFSDALIELRNAYTGVTASSGGLITRRWLLAFKKISGSSEGDASLSTATTIRFFFPIFGDNSQSNFDWRIAHMSPGARPPLPNASTLAPGRALLGETGGRVGSVNIRSAGVPVLSSLASTRFHTINFIDGDGFVIQTTTGEVTVGKIGEKGLTGPPGQSGGVGPVGDQGVGFTAIAPFYRSAIFTNPSPWAASPYTYNVSMGLTIRNLSVQIGRFWDAGAFSPGPPTDYIEITAVSGIGTGVATVEFTLSGDTMARIIVSAAGD